MKNQLNEYLDRNNTANFIIFLHMIAWGIAIKMTFFPNAFGSDAAGNGMANAFAVLLVALPCMVFIFFSNFYFVFKNGLTRRYRFFAGLTFIGLITLYFSINW